MLFEKPHHQLKVRRNFQICTEVAEFFKISLVGVESRVRGVPAFPERPRLVLSGVRFPQDFCGVIPVYDVQLSVDAFRSGA